MGTRCAPSDRVATAATSSARLKNEIMAEKMVHAHDASINEGSMNALVA